jgi:DNA anti-recombination protein RmuC
LFLLQDASGLESPNSLLEAYSLRDQTEDSTATSLKSQENNEYNHLPKEKEVVISVNFSLVQSYSYGKAEKECPIIYKD